METTEHKCAYCGSDSCDAVVLCDLCCEDISNYETPIYEYRPGHVDADDQGFIRVCDFCHGTYEQKKTFNLATMKLIVKYNPDEEWTNEELDAMLAIVGISQEQVFKQFKEMLTRRLPPKWLARIRIEKKDEDT